MRHIYFEKKEIPIPEGGHYESLHDSVGPLHGNALMDWAMFSILSCTNVASSFPWDCR